MSKVTAWSLPCVSQLRDEVFCAGEAQRKSTESQQLLCTLPCSNGAVRRTRSALVSEASSPAAGRDNGMRKSKTGSHTAVTTCVIPGFISLRVHRDLA